MKGGENLLTITDINGNVEGLTGYKGLKRKRNVNGEKTLSFIVLPTEQNDHSFNMVQEESVIEFNGDTYRIKRITEKNRGKIVYKEVVAIRTMFDLIDLYQYETHTGSMTFSAALNFVLGDTVYTWDIIDTFYAQNWENFGNDNLLALFQSVLKRYDAEFTLNGTHFTFKHKIGNSTDFQFRYNYNIKTITRNVNTNNLSTYIKGFGKKREDGTYLIESEYTSPNAAIFGIRHAKPVSDERYTTLEGLNERLAEIKDTPDVSITIDFVDMRRAGYPFDVPNEGDDVFLIYEPLKNLDLETRLIEVDEEFEEGNPYPIKTAVTLANYRQNMTDKFVEYSRTQKTVNDIVEGNRKLPYNVLDDAVKRATEALQSAQTEVEFENGIILRSKVNPNHFVLENSEGIGITVDGGTSFEEAITAIGINTKLLTAGQIKTNNIQIIGEDNLFYWDGNSLIAIDSVDPNKFARIKSGEIYVAKGAMTVERPDGYKLVNNGLANWDFSVQSHDPPYMEAPIQLYYFFWRTSSLSYAACNFYTYRHVARYLKVELSVGVESNAQGKIRLIDRDGVTQIWSLTHSNWIGDDGNLSNLGTTVIATVDLGIPTGGLKSFYVQLATSDSTKFSYARVIRAWLEG